MHGAENKFIEFENQKGCQSDGDIREIKWLDHCFTAGY